MSRLRQYFDEFNTWSQPRRTLAVLVAVLLLTQALAFSTSLWELLSLARSPASEQVGGLTRRPTKRPVLKPDLHPLDILAADVRGTTTKMRQRMPGAGEYAAEAIYAPLNQELAVRNPFSVYVSVTYYSSRRTASAVIKQRLADLKIKPDRVDIGGRRAAAGLSAGKETYFVGWVAGRYGFELDAAFARRVPGEPGAMIELTNAIARDLNVSAGGRMGAAEDQ